MPKKYRGHLDWFVLLKLAALAFALLFSARTSHGFCLQPDPTVRCEFLNSDVVFVGTVTLEHPQSQQGDLIDGWTYRLTVLELFRGPHTRTIEVYTENASARFPLQVGKRYLLFATKSNGRLEITSCGKSALLIKAANAIEELRRIRPPAGAEIEGRISFSEIPDSGTHVAGVHIIIRGNGPSLEAISDRNGRFHLHVPPGIYSADVEQIPGWTITPYDLSYDDPEHFDARKGHCFGLQFLAHPN
jgi:hypothetical protein